MTQPCPPAVQHQDWDTPGHTASHARTCPCHQQRAAFTLRAWQPNQRSATPTRMPTAVVPPQRKGPCRPPRVHSLQHRGLRTRGERAMDTTGHLLHEATSPRAGSATHLPNTQSQRQNEATGEYVPNEGIKENPRGRTKWR